MMGPRNIEKKESDQVQHGDKAGDGGESAACAAEQAPEVTDQLYGSGPYKHICIHIYIHPLGQCGPMNHFSMVFGASIWLGCDVYSNHTLAS